MNKNIIASILFIVIVVVLLWAPVINRPIFALANLSNLFSLSSVIDDSIDLKKENIKLEEEMYAMRMLYVLPAKDEYVGAKVYSLYPFNDKQKLYINIGNKNGVHVGDVVVFGKYVFVGEITKTAKYKSEVLTVFDNDFSIAVRIGNNEVDGLMSGGVNPMVKLIDKTKQISVGDNIISVSRDVPYGLSMGSVASIDEDESGAFFNAGVRLPYTLNDLRDVFVINAFNEKTK